jgi:hypothetical protein
LTSSIFTRYEHIYVKDLGFKVKGKECFGYTPTRVARWIVFKPKIQIGVNFGGSCKG